MSNSKTPMFDSHFNGYRLFIGDLDRVTTRYDVEEVFGQYGELLDVWLARNPPGFAFLVYKTAEECERASRHCHGKKIHHQRIRVEFARPYDERKENPPAASAGDATLNPQPVVAQQQLPRTVQEYPGNYNGASYSGYHASNYSYSYHSTYGYHAREARDYRDDYRTYSYRPRSYERSRYHRRSSRRYRSRTRSRSRDRRYYRRRHRRHRSRRHHYRKSHKRRSRSRSRSPTTSESSYSSRSPSPSECESRSESETDQRSTTSQQSLNGDKNASHTAIAAINGPTVKRENPDLPKMGMKVKKDRGTSPAKP